MATWQVGPFDNDDAAEWCADLENADSQRRVELIHLTLRAAARAGNVTAADGTRAVAAAATVVQCDTGRPVSDSPYAPRFLMDSQDIVVDQALRDLAARALDAVLGEASAWRALWSGDIEEDEAFAVVERLRAALRGAIS
jgi:hypothetical protein